MPRRLLPALGLLAVVLSVAGAASAARAPRRFRSDGDKLYVALGDSYTVGWEGGGSPTPGFVGPLFGDYQTSLGATQLVNTGKPGESTSGMLANGQLQEALADIEAPSDTVAVTIEIGGADALLSNSCTGHFDDPGCSFRANYSSILTQIQAALANDPGDESFLTTAYPNPATGTGTPTETNYDAALLGSNGKVNCSDTGAAVGLDDAIFQEAGALGVPVADPYPAFKAHGQSYMAADDPMHLHPNDNGYAAIAEAFRHTTTPCDSAVDHDPPKTKIVSGPVSGKTHDRTPKFKFSSSEAGSTFRCALDDASFKTCRSPYTTPRLKPGRHALKIAAKDQAGNVDPTPAKAKFKVVK
jgi:lysophospholipase L1-like esterase